VPLRASADPDNVRLERQLDEAGRAGATAMGVALRALKIPIGVVLSSPTYRALETIRLARLGPPKTDEALGDGGQSMRGVSEAQSAWLRARARELPAKTNTIIVTHLPNITRAVPSVSPEPADGEVLVFGAATEGWSRLIGRIKMEDWRDLR